MKPRVSTGKSTELYSERLIGSPESKAPVARAASVSGNWPNS